MVEIKKVPAIVTKSKPKLFGKEAPVKVDRAKGGYTFYFANGTKEFVTSEQYLK